MWTHLGIWRLQEPLLDEPGDGAGGGAGADAGAGGDDGADGDAADAGDGEAGADGDDDAGDGQRRAAGADDDVDPEDLELEQTLDALPVEERAKNQRTRLRRLQRQVRSSRQVLEQLRDEQGRPLPATEIRRRLSLAADMEELEGFFGEHPDVLQTIVERKRGGGRAAAAAEEAFVDPYANEEKLPFDTTTESGKFFLENMRRGARENFELRQALKRLDTGVQGLARHTSTQADLQVEGTWKTATLDAAKRAGLEGPYLNAFVNAVYGDYRLGRAEKRLAKMTPAQAIQRHLGLYTGLAKQQRRTAVASQHQRVAANAGRPGPQRRGAPTTATDTTKTGTIKDARQSFFQRVGQNVPAR